MEKEREREREREREKTQEPVGRVSIVNLMTVGSKPHCLLAGI